MTATSDNPDTPATEVVPAGGADPAESTASPAGPRVLLIDDSEIVRRVVAARLNEAGFAVTSVESAVAALELPAHPVFDAVVCDVAMEFVTGVHFTRVLRSEAPTATTPIILLTAADDPRSRFWGRNAGADAYVCKEDMERDLIPSLQQLLADRLPPLGTMPPPRAESALARISRVLDQNLFEAVISAETRELMAHVHERAAFERALLAIVNDVVDCAYATLDLNGAVRRTRSLLCRTDLDEETLREQADRVDLPVAAPPSNTRRQSDPPGMQHPSDIVLVREPSIRRRGATEIVAGPSRAMLIETRGELLGSLHIFGGEAALVGEAIRAARSLTEAIAPVVKVLFLMEEGHRDARTDHLTSLCNRRHAEERLAEELSRFARHQHPLTVALCDIDGFTAINDAFGRTAGDAVLRATARLFEAHVRTSDLVARWSGAELMLILPDSSLAGARIVAERLRHSISEARVRGGPPRFTASFGIAQLREHDTMTHLLERADRALRRAKSRGRNRVELDL